MAMRIFLVEDSKQIRERLVELIDALGGHTVVGAADNYDDAVSGICHSKPDVAIFDIKLARGNGILETGGRVLRQIAHGEFHA